MMKTIKKRYKVLLGILILILLIPPFKIFVLKDSVMEEVYRSIGRNYLNVNKFEGINKIDYENIEGQLWMSSDSYFHTSFQREYIDNNYKIYLTFSINEAIDNIDIRIKGVYYVSENDIIHLLMYYNHENRTMTYDPVFWECRENDSVSSSTTYFDKETITQYLSDYGITKEDIKDYQHYILYDVVYQSWVSGTDNGRKLNKWDYYNIKEVDNTFNFEVTE